MRLKVRIFHVLPILLIGDTVSNINIFLIAYVAPMLVMMIAAVNAALLSRKHTGYEKEKGLSNARFIAGMSLAPVANVIFGVILTIIFIFAVGNGIINSIAGNSFMDGYRGVME